MVDRLDDGTITAELGPLDYKGLYKAICYEKFLWTGNVGYLCSFLTPNMVSRLLEEPSSGHM